MKKEFSQQQSLSSLQSKYKKKLFTQQDILQIKKSYQKIQNFVKNIDCQKMDSQQLLSKYQVNKISPSHILQISQERIQKIIKNKKIKTNWTQVERLILNWIVANLAIVKSYKNIYDEFRKQDWKYVSQMIKHKNWKDCMFKWLNQNIRNMNKSNWTEKENQNLKQIVEQLTEQKEQISWNKVSKKLYLIQSKNKNVFRTPKQCKQHWNLILIKSKKTSWTREQDILLFKTLKQNKAIKKWSLLTSLFDGRTQNAIKNRYNLIISKQIKQQKNFKNQQLQTITNYLAKCEFQKYNVIIEPDSNQQKQKQQQ